MKSVSSLLEKFEYKRNLATIFRFLHFKRVVVPGRPKVPTQLSHSPLPRREATQLTPATMDTSKNDSLLANGQKNDEECKRCTILCLTENSALWKPTEKIIVW